MIKDSLTAKIALDTAYVLIPDTRCDQTSNCDFYLDQLKNMRCCGK